MTYHSYLNQQNNMHTKFCTCEGNNEHLYKFPILYSSPVSALFFVSDDLSSLSMFSKLQNTLLRKGE